MYRPFASSVPKPTPFLDVETIIRGLTQDLCTAFNTGNYDQAGALFAANGQFLSRRKKFPTFDATSLVNFSSFSARA